MLQAKEDSRVLDPPDKFPFPFTPYPIQEAFMRALYSAIEGKKLGIFESPTGTGKSLSLICGSLSWLKDHDKREREEVADKLKKLEEEASKVDTVDSPDWFAVQTSQVGTRQKQYELKQEKDKIDRYDKNIAKLEESFQKRKQNDLKEEKERMKASQRKKCADKSEISLRRLNEEDDEDIILDDVIIFGKAEDVSDEEDSVDSFDGTKIFFCSRTHSQLAQFVGEVQRSAFSEDIRLVSLASRQYYCINETVSKLRNMALINERCLDLQKNKGSKVTGKGDDGVAAKKQKTGTKGCSFMSSLTSSHLKESALFKVQDVEQLVSTGKTLGACPYYASRSAVEFAQVVVLPYNTLLHKATRKASGLNLSDSVVIIDEAHNLLEAVGHMHSSLISGQQLAHAHSQLVQYRDRYQSRFSPSNLLFLNRFIFVVGKLLRLIGGKPGKDPSQLHQDSDSKMLTLQEFMLLAEIDNINMYDLLEFSLKSKLSHKLHGYAEKYQPSVVLRIAESKLQPENPTVSVRAFLKDIESKDKGQKNVQPASPVTAPSSPPVETQQSNNPLLGVLAFFETLTNDCEDGRFLIQKHKLPSKSTIKFVLLNPASHFRDIVRDARSVIVAGGTMQPLSQFEDQLFKAAGGDPNRIMHFSCSHVVPPENILALAVGAGPSGKKLDFSYTSRATLDTLNELSHLLENVARVVPGGVVCFLPSYDYEQLVNKHMEGNSALNRIEMTKKVFREPKSSSQVEEILSQYSKCIRRTGGGSGQTGALLFSVIGGKLSEGLNFSDDLGRCVIVIGLPYPNIKSAELQEQMKFLDTNVSTVVSSTILKMFAIQDSEIKRFGYAIVQGSLTNQKRLYVQALQSSPPPSTRTCRAGKRQKYLKIMGPGRGREYLENLCMKAVNQSIGRAVRHRDDYATVLLVDKRYLQPSRQNGLPQWIRKSLHSHEKFGPAFSMIGKFFSGRKKNS